MLRLSQKFVKNYSSIIKPSLRRSSKLFFSNSELVDESKSLFIMDTEERADIKSNL